jgi:hypothetical protein
MLWPRVQGGLVTTTLGPALDTKTALAGSKRMETAGKHRHQCPA